LQDREEANDIDTFIKQPREKFPVSVDFTNRLESGEVLSSVEYAASLAGMVVTTDIIDSCSILGNSVLILVKGGISGLNYELTVLVTSSSGYKYEKDLLMQVLNL